MRFGVVLRATWRGSQLMARTRHPSQPFLQSCQTCFRSSVTYFPTTCLTVFLRRGAADHEIQLEAGAIPPSRPTYRLSKPEMDELQRQLTEMLKKGLIEPSKSPFGAPVFFVKKSDGSLRMVCDWRQLNRTL